VPDLPQSLTAVLRDADASYPLPVTVDLMPRGSIDDVNAWITVDGESKLGVRAGRGPASAELIADIADQVGDWLVEQLPVAGLPAVWPPCPLHPGAHPLQARVVEDEASWMCPVVDGRVAAVGSLG